jgi:tetratricopeptide (TPR) repeat protein
MGSRLALLAATQLIAAAVLTRDAAADTKKTRDLYKRGIEEYKAQKYEAAAATLKEAYALDPKPNTLFALAQAERLAGRCPDARAHYKELLESTTEVATAKAVQTNLELCGAEPEQPVAREREPATTPETTPRTITETKTVVREVGRTDKLATLLFSGGMLGLGAGGGLYLASTNSREDADRALTLDDHARLNDRADLQRIASFAAVGAGVAMISVAVVRWVTAGETKPTEVTLAPSATGAMLMVSSGW